MKNAITRNLKDPTLATAEVIPTSTMDVPAQEPVVPTEDLINDALRHRAELVESRIDLNSREISNKAVRSALLPTIDAFAYYGGAGLGGSQNPANLCANQTPDSRSCNSRSLVAPDHRGRLQPPPPLASAVPTTNSSTPPLPIRASVCNSTFRCATARPKPCRSAPNWNIARPKCVCSRSRTKLAIEVRNAQFAVQQNRASVDSAKAAVDLARQSLDAEQKKYQFGTSTTTLVLQYQSQLATAESTLVNAMVAYEKSRIELDRATGQLAGSLWASASTMPPAAKSRACPTFPTLRRARICLRTQPRRPTSSRNRSSSIELQRICCGAARSRAPVLCTR